MRGGSEGREGKGVKGGGSHMKEWRVRGWRVSESYKGCVRGCS